MIDFSALSEESVESIIQNAVTKKFLKDRSIKTEEAKVNFINLLTEENTTVESIDAVNLQSKINNFSPEEHALYEGIEKIKTLEPGTIEYKEQLNINLDLLIL